MRAALEHPQRRAGGRRLRPTIRDGRRIARRGAELPSPRRAHKSRRAPGACTTPSTGTPSRDERDVHRVIGQAVDELARAVERIDEPEARAMPARSDARGMSAFLRDDRHVRIDAPEPRHDERRGRAVGVGHGAAVGLRHVRRTRRRACRG